MTRPLSPEARQPILLLGAGAIGTLLGARLALAGFPVTLVGRPRLRAAIARDGLTLRLDGAAQRVPPLHVATSVAQALAEGGPFSHLLLTTKAHDVAPALHELCAATALPLPIACFQNGVGSEEVAAAIVGPARLIAATLTIPAEFEAPAVLATRHKGGVGLAAWPGSDGSAVAALAEALRQGGVRVRAFEAARAMKWSKLLLNMIGNATSALLGWPPPRTLADPRLYAVELDALAEAHAVMAAQGLRPVALPGYAVPVQMALLRALPRPLTRPLMRRLVAGGRGGKMPSLFLALEAGQRSSEVTVLNGAVAAQGAALAVPTPTNARLSELVVALAEGQLPRAHFHHKPAALLAALGR